MGYKSLLIVFNTLILALLLGVKGVFASPGEKKKEHPKLTEQEKLITCRDCHKDVTPEIYNEWFESAHGIANVRCYQCHGTYENFRVEPELSSCSSCHTKEIQNLRLPPERKLDKTCWNCHPIHGFKVHQ